MQNLTMKQDTIIQTAKALPAVGGATYATLTLNEWVATVTIIYVVLQAVILLHKHYYFIKDKRKK